MGGRQNDQWDGAERRSGSHWVFKKEISLTHIVTTISGIVAIALWAVTVETRFIEISSKVDTNTKTSQAIAEHLKNIDSKLDEVVRNLEYLRGQNSITHPDQPPQRK